MSRANVGFIGLGDQGAPMAEALIGAHSLYLGAPPRHDHGYACAGRTSRTAEELRNLSSTATRPQSCGWSRYAGLTV
jgi:3-hydroxyisobutyrate dehydrogenase-like beta-hydroxyacid dehydrogenase